MEINFVFNKEKKKKIRAHKQGFLKPIILTKPQKA